MQIWGKKAWITTILKLWQNSVNQTFNLNAFFFFLLTGAQWYYHTIYLVFTYFASFTDYEYDIFEVISNLHIQGSNFGGKIAKFCGKSFKKFNSTEFMMFVFSKSVPWYMWPTQSWGLNLNMWTCWRSKVFEICQILLLLFCLNKDQFWFLRMLRTSSAEVRRKKN